MENIKKINKKWWILIGIILLIIVITLCIIFTVRNKMTPEETVSRFMYLIENKEYEKAKKLCIENLEKLDVLSNIKPSNLSFNFTQDKKNATATILEDEIEVTNMNIEIKNTLLGWKIRNYNIETDLIEPQTIEDRIKSGKTVSNIQLLYWGESDVASKDEIKEYIEDNLTVAMIFAEAMKEQKYDKANELYAVISESDLSVDNLKEYNWNNYKITNNFEIMNNFNSVTVELDNKKIWIYVAGKVVTSIKEATI